MDTLLLTQHDVRRVITTDLALAAVEHAFACHGRGEVQMPPKVYLDLSHHHGDFRAMPAYLDGAAGVKWIASHPENPHRHNLPAVIGLYVLSDPATALPLAVMDANLLTSYRTGAAAAVASKHLARSEPETVAFIGCGVQARHILDAHRRIFGEGFTALMADISRQAAEQFAEEVGGRAVSVEEAAGADVVCTATPSRAPLIRREWIRQGAHVNAMGADGPGKQELDPQILRDARLFADDLEQAAESGEINVPFAQGELSRQDVAGTLGEVISGYKEGRQEPAQITLFDSTGLAVQDLALVRRIYEQARDGNVGTAIRFM
ncbi:MAG: ornithine cyclodeaminase family protein [Myxococcota bacterium]